jgi:hypothetical protein
MQIKINDRMRAESHCIRVLLPLHTSKATSNDTDYFAKNGEDNFNVHNVPFWGDF